MKKTLRRIYKYIRTFLFTLILIGVTLYIGLYVALSIPGVQQRIKGVAEREASAFLKSEVKIDRLMIVPFSEVKMKGVNIYTPDCEKCINVNTLGAGINLWRLVSTGKIEITYAELIGLDAKISKSTPESPLNIQFIIDVLSPKDKSKPPTLFDIKLYSVVIRNSKLSYDILSVPTEENQVSFNPNHVALTELRADVALPRIKNDDFIIDLRRLSFTERSGFRINRLTAYAHITDKLLEVSKFSLKFPEGRLSISDFSLHYDSLKNISKGLESGEHNLKVKGEELHPRTFCAFYNPLKDLGGSYNLDIDVSGNIHNLHLSNFSLISASKDLDLKVKASISEPMSIKDFRSEIFDVKLKSTSNVLSWAATLLPEKSGKAKNIFGSLSDVDMDVSGDISMPSGESKVKTKLLSNLGSVDADVELRWKDKNNLNISGAVTASSLSLGEILEKENIGSITFDAEGDVYLANNDVTGFADMTVSELGVNGVILNDIKANIAKEGKETDLFAEIHDEIVDGEISGTILMDKDESNYNLNAIINSFIPSRLNVLSQYKDYNLKGKVSADITGNDIDNLTGDVMINNIQFGKLGQPSLALKSVTLHGEQEDSIRSYNINSEFLRGELAGKFTFRDLEQLGRELACRVSPSFMPKYKYNTSVSTGYANLNLTLLPNQNMVDFFKMKIKPYTEVNILGHADGAEGEIALNINAPYILKGKDKLIRNSSVSLLMDHKEGLSGEIKSTIPAKNDDAALTIDINGLNDKFITDLSWTFQKNKSAKGKISLDGDIRKNLLNGNPEVGLNINSSEFELKGSKWNIDRSHVSYSDGVIDVNELRIWHGGQFVNISGTASDTPMDVLKVKLAGIDLSYIFEALNINYVTFGGTATGEIAASSLLSKVPVLKTERLFVKDFSYNGAVLGNARLESHWINEQKKIAINADIREGNHRTVLVGGGIFLGKDSLSFDFLADKVNIEFLKPFMAAFTSDVGGRASGRVKLFGNFKDIDLTGEAFADSISMKVDYTNVYYHGRDSVHLRKGEISIPQFRLYDCYGNSGLLSGSVRHRYFHDPEFEFKLTDANKLLAFDTNPTINKDWYGKIYANGGGSLRGVPGYISMLLDVSTAPGSDFTFVLSETQTASEYNFLTFSDKKKEELVALEGEVSVEEQLYKSLPKPNESLPSIFSMDIRCSVTPGALLTLVMDPKSNDRIRARGEGPMQISYDTKSDNMKIYGKYTLTEGNYNFSLQDLILKDFKINQGSSIAFNGDPMQGVLDITAAYRVNTNLSDLDKSFSTDRDLNRTNVPVDALLKVTGDMRSPEIGFDISLPTLTQDVERKVKSIISTEDMMSRQIIYLLALNRFYTPEYMGSTSNGGELASVASSTLSSQLSNIMGQLTDKVSLAPSFRSDKGDFSDMEVDLALSSRLLDNRLLINGNFGYRDRSTSQSTFIGDFDIEYLLNRNGGLRLKAYNHFNDQNYYLRSALTTQGIGVIYRKDFDNPFTFLKRRKDKNKESRNK